MKISFSKWFKKHTKRQDKTAHLFNVSRDWKINIVIFLLAVLLIVISSLIFYMQIVNESVFNIKMEAEDHVTTFDREKLKSIADSMILKGERREDIKNRAASGFDPSL